MEKLQKNFKDVKSKAERLIERAGEQKLKPHLSTKLINQLTAKKGLVEEAIGSIGMMQAADDGSDYEDRFPTLLTLKDDFARLVELLSNSISTAESLANLDSQPVG